MLDALGVGSLDTEGLRGGSWEPPLRCLSERSANDALRAAHLLHVR